VADPAVDHAAALHGMLTAAVEYTVYLGEVTDPDDALTLPYLVVWPPPPERPTLTLGGYGGEITTTTQVTAVGRDVIETIAAMGRASFALHGQRPVIPGRECGLIGQVPGQLPTPRPDERVRVDGRPVYVTFALFRLMSSS
jgi:hypothetical protein